ncbi:MAG TPA: cellulase family glycosylhydrolase [Treponemataceae bacterium]|nr:cellulase family glycosylhydrolase [Treponemataceae bacterium]
MRTSPTRFFYAASHGKWLRDRADAAMASDIAIFVTEWGTCDASGNSNFDATASDAWLSWMDAKGLSWCNWSLNDKDETASALKPGASASGAWSKSDLTESGLYVMYNMRKGGTFQ